MFARMLHYRMTHSGFLIAALLLLISGSADAETTCTKWFAYMLGTTFPTQLEAALATVDKQNVTISRLWPPCTYVFVGCNGDLCTEESKCWGTAGFSISCIKSAQAVYTISLTGGSEIEPWHKKWDKNHKTSNLSYTATVKGSSGQPVSGVQVTVTTDVALNSGGHQHSSGRPKGKLVIPPDPVKDGKESIQGVTDANGVFSFTYGAEEASGEHSLKATCASCKEPATATINVAVKGLMQLDPAPLNYELRGSLPEHPDNHYFSPAAMVKIINLAHEYRIDPDFKQLLKINDSSLIKGGSFDILQNWTSESGMHGGHREGVVVDINNYAEPSPRFERFAQGHGIDARWHPNGTAPHYHLLLLGKDR